MSTITEIRGVPVQFPFQPYDIQKDYMEKVIECVQTESVAVLESPTGTGKTLSLLCSTLAWLQLKKAQIQAQLQTKNLMPSSYGHIGELNSELEEKAGGMASGRMFLGAPTIIYASRTHSQLSQAITELKRTAYSHMRANVLGSRDQLCIHPEVKAEADHSARLQMCKVKLASKSCHFNNRTEKMMDNPQVCNTPIVDIEDMIKLGTTHTFCPYYMTKKMKDKADIIFTPYNYLLDLVARKGLGFQLCNSVIILDEGHNIEQLCEDYASVEVKTTDLLLAITELDVIMKYISETPSFIEDSGTDIDIKPDEVAICKAMLIKFVDIVQEVPLNSGDYDVTNYPGNYIFEILGKANITKGNVFPLLALANNMIKFLANQGRGPFARRGKGLQLLVDFLTIVFVNNGMWTTDDLQGTRKKLTNVTKFILDKRNDGSTKEEPLIRGSLRKTRQQMLEFYVSGVSVQDLGESFNNFWFREFTRGRMDLIMKESIIALILTSGTLAPLKPLITELRLNVKVQLENPHVITPSQICVKILPVGPDGEPLNSSYQNRENPRYLTSLGRAIVNLSRIIPDGLLIFFPSYPIMQKCQNAWQEQGIWASIMSQKAIFVEPRDKDAFNEAMTGYYEKIRDPTLKGAIFMAVCRGKVAEGLDFADANGRAVIITGLPYPPLKDPKVILKRRYLDHCHANNKEFLNGADWYSLEASRAVNQAIGRVIRHRHDYGAILLLDQRFSGEHIKQRMSKWLRNHVKLVTKYGEVIRDLSQFFRKAQGELPAPKMKPPINAPSATFDFSQTYKKGNFDFSTSSLPGTKALITDGSATDEDSVKQYLGTTDNPNGSVTLHSVKRDNSGPLVNSRKRKKIQLIPKHSISEVVEVDRQTTITEYVLMLKQKLGDNFKGFANALQHYSTTSDLDEFLQTVDTLVPQNLRYVFVGLYKFIKSVHSDQYKEFLKRNNLSVPEEY